MSFILLINRYASYLISRTHRGYHPKISFTEVKQRLLRVALGWGVGWGGVGWGRGGGGGEAVVESFPQQLQLITWPVTINDFFCYMLVICMCMCLVISAQY